MFKSEVLQLNELDFFCPVKKVWIKVNHSEYVNGTTNWPCDCEIDQSLGKLSIITSVLDRDTEFQESLKSLSNQKDIGIWSHSRIEHVVHEGKEQSLKKPIIEKYSNQHTILHIKKDFSLYQGFNYGLQISTGKTFAFLNSDDSYAHDFISQADNYLRFTNADWVFGDCVLYIGNESKLIPGKPDYFIHSWSNFSRFHHTTVLAKREILEEIGNFPEFINNEKIYYCADYAWFLMAQKSGFYGAYNPNILGHMVWGGASSDNTNKIYPEAARMAVAVNPEKKQLIILIWLARWIDNKVSAKFSNRILGTIRHLGRLIYSKYFQKLDNIRIESK